MCVGRVRDLAPSRGSHQGPNLYATEPLSIKGLSNPSICVISRHAILYYSVPGFTLHANKTQRLNVTNHAFVNRIVPVLYRPMLYYVTFIMS